MSRDLNPAKRITEAAIGVLTILAVLLAGPLPWWAVLFPAAFAILVRLYLADQEATKAQRIAVDSPRWAAAANIDKFVVIDRLDPTGRLLFRRSLDAYLAIFDSRSATQQVFDANTLERDLSQQVWATAAGLEACRVPLAQFERSQASVRSAQGRETVAGLRAELDAGLRELVRRVEDLEDQAREVRKADAALAEADALDELHDLSPTDALSRMAGEGAAGDLTVGPVASEVGLLRGAARERRDAALRSLMRRAQ